MENEQQEEKMALAYNLSTALLLWEQLQHNKDSLQLR
jgi:hypothetical protein